MDIIGVNADVRMLLGNLQEPNGELLLIEAVTEQSQEINVYNYSVKLLHMQYLNTDSAGYLSATFEVFSCTGILAKETREQLVVLKRSR